MDNEYRGILWDDIDKILSRKKFQPDELIKSRTEFAQKAYSLHKMAVEQRKWKLAHDLLVLILRIQNDFSDLPPNTPEVEYSRILEDNFPLLDEIERRLRQ